MTRARSALRDFLHGEAAGGLVLIVAAVLAMVIANLPQTAHSYEAWLHAETGPVLARDLGPMTVHLWINDAAMALFFLLVGLEIKREFVDGRLATWDRRRLPFLAAAAGMAVPALVFLSVAGEGRLQPGWAIPAATDIAFAIGIMALLGSRVPPALKLLLTTIAIVDDLGAVAIIAIAYTESIHAFPLAGAGLALLVLYVMGRRGVAALWPYLLVGAALWLFVLQSGVHATIAGVLTAAFIPVVPTPGAPDAAHSPLHRLEHALHPLVAYAVVPLFAFANAGVSLAGISLAVLTQPLVLGIAAGLFLGKQIGIFASIWGAVRLGIATKPGGVTWLQLYGMALLAGIGFTMSLFIGGLAFPGDVLLGEDVKIGVLVGSIASAFGGIAILSFAPPEILMRRFFAPAQLVHAPARELHNGGFTAYAETPSRAEAILAAIGGAEPPEDRGEAPILAVHAPGYIAFLKDAPAMWAAAGRPGDAIPYVFPVVGRRPLRLDRIDALMGQHAFDATTPITPDTWTSAYWSAQTALAATHAVLGGARAAFALCRPPGHHAGTDYCGGYCHLNVAAIAAQAARDAGHAKVAILDIDYHHGNGTQDIFWTRGDVIYASVHADPASDYPFYWGHADETGEGAGKGATLNLPLPHGTTLAAFRAALAIALAAIRDFGAGLIVVSFGADTWEGDPISHFALQTPDYALLAADIAALGLPTVIVMEGGYAVDALGANVAGFLSGF